VRVLVEADNAGEYDPFIKPDRRLNWGDKLVEGENIPTSGMPTGSCSGLLVDPMVVP
jgi:hypothetical protein